MKKPTVIIGKKQIIMTCLTLMLAVAVYINYSTAPSAAKSDSTEELVKFKKLYDDGVITEEEFTLKKKQILGI